jgi:hypothetical protein
MPTSRSNRSANRTKKTVHFVSGKPKSVTKSNSSRTASGRKTTSLGRKKNPSGAPNAVKRNGLKAVKNAEKDAPPKRKKKVSGRGPVRGSQRNVGSGSHPHSSSGPGWTDLKAFNNERVEASQEPDSGFRALSTLRFAIGVLAVVGLITVYVGHVYATETLLTELQHVRQEKLVLSLEYNALKGDYDRKIGPGVIFDRARKLGLEERSGTGPEIRIQP